MPRPIIQGLALSAVILVSTGCPSASDATDPAREPVKESTPTSAPTPDETNQLEQHTWGATKRLHKFGDVFLASQPSPEDFEQAKRDGVRTVINQRHEAENEDFDERAVVTALGLRYVNQPFNGAEELTDDVLDTTLDLLRTAERPILLHCSSANRSGAIWFAYRVLDDGLSMDDALAEAKTVGLRTPAYEEIVRAYIEKHGR